MSTPSSTIRGTKADSFRRVEVMTATRSCARRGQPDALTRLALPCGRATRTVTGACVAPYGNVTALSTPDLIEGRGPERPTRRSQ